MMHAQAPPFSLRKNTKLPWRNLLFVSLRMEITSGTKENQLDGDSFLVDDKTPTLSGISRPLQAMFLGGGAAKLHQVATPP
jgi:hypothetical protein